MGNVTFSTDIRLPDATWLHTVNGCSYIAWVGNRKPADHGRVRWDWYLGQADCRTQNFVHASSADEDAQIETPPTASAQSVLESLSSFYGAWLDARGYEDSENADLFTESALFFEDVYDEFYMDMTCKDDELQEI